MTILFLFHIYKKVGIIKGQDSRGLGGIRTDIGAKCRFLVSILKN
jgi:hypothetical protein